jgi:hypothetical protein
MKMASPKILKDLMILRATLQQYHPLVIEGSGHRFDTRCASTVANRIVNSLQLRWEEQNMTKPIIIMSQGDPLQKSGISAITSNVAKELGVKRCLVCFDDHIDPQHSVDADRENVIYEMKYSQLLDVLNEHDEHLFRRLEQAVERKLAIMSDRRKKVGKDPVASYYKDYALLQEVTKAAMKIVSGDLTLAHTVEEIAEFSVTSFYSVGIDLGLVHEEDVVSYVEMMD